VTKRLLEPQFDHEKEYLVRTEKLLKESQLSWLARGVKLEDGYITKPAEVFADGDYICRIVLTEGKKHQIRRMITAVGNEVKDLQRIRVMNIELGKLNPGEYREIKGAELKKLLTNLGL
jgi:pseudouridine synthase